MLKSMTGFARCETSNDTGDLAWELRAVNHRYLDLQFRLHDALRSEEAAFRKQISDRIGRGKLECTFHFRRGSAARTFAVDHEQLDKILAEAASVSEKYTHDSTVNVVELLRWPGVMKEPEIEIDELAGQAHALLTETLEKFDRMRSREGERLAQLLQSRCESIGDIAATVRQRRPVVIESIREKMRERVARLEAEIDPQRLDAELVLIAQKLDIDEELDRLDSHLVEIKDVLTRNEPVGRRLDFLMQELNREANTLASKSADAETSTSAVDIKVLIEQMREQIQNIE